MNNAQKIAHLLAAIENCEKAGNTEWRDKHSTELARIVRDVLPSGSGFDAGTQLHDGARPEKLVFLTSFHHMRDGMYDGWTEHTVTVVPSFVYGLDIRVSGRNRNEIKDYISGSFHLALSSEHKA